jgi:MFS family permease
VPQLSDAAARVDVARPSEPWPSPAAGWYAIGVLLAIYTCSFVDRQIIALMVQPIRRDLQISDTEISLLQGFAFAVFYVLGGLPFGWAADRYSRRVIIVIGTNMWSAATALCGMAGSFGQLFAARVGVGIGEASFGPSAQSIVTDMFPKERLGRAMGVYNLGVSLGSGMAFLIGGTVVSLIGSAESVTVPVLGEMRSWQATFLIVGLPGVLLALLMFTFAEPRRRERMAIAGAADPNAPAPLRIALVWFWDNVRTYGFWVAGNSFLGLVLFGYGAWMVTSLIRTFGWSAGETGQLYGVLTLVFGMSGSVLAGVLADELVKRGVASAYNKVLGWICVAMFPFAVAAPLIDNATLAIVVTAGAIFFANAYPGMSSAALFVVTPNQMRGQLVAIKYFFSSTASFTVAPTVIAVLTDFVFQDDQGVRHSIALVSAVSIPIAWVCYRMARRSFDAMLLRRSEWLT